MGSDFYEDILSDIDETYDKAEGKNELIPVGEYRALIADATLDRNEDTGIVSLVLKLKITAPTSIGRVIYHRNQLVKDPDRIKFVKKDIQTCGVQLEKLSQVGKHLEDFKGRVLEIKVVHKGKYANAYLNSLVGRVEDAVEAASNNDDDGVPF